MAKGRERTAKYYFKNEKEVMEELGFKPTEGSGSGWLNKEDGENDYLLAQLKSTDKRSYKLNQLDIEKLEYHASVSSKTPVFILQFLNNDSRYALMAIEDIPKVAEYIKTGNIKKPPNYLEINLEGTKELNPIKQDEVIKSSKNSRDKFYKNKEKEWENKRWKK